MPADRRTPARGKAVKKAPPARRTPGSTAGRSSCTSAASRARSAQAAQSAESARAAAVAASAARPRLTGRAAVLVLVVAVLVVSYASSLRAYLQQRSTINEYERTIAERRADIEELEREKRRWEDPQYVAQQARERLGYVRPGETPFVVLRNGEPLEPEGDLTDPASLITSTPPPWWEGAWDSVLIAGNPQKQTRPPLTELDGSQGGTSE